MENNPNELEATQATSPESLQSEKTPLDLPLPAVHGRGVRTGESIDPGAAREAARSTGTIQPESASDDDLLGTTYVGKYELISIIGSGGMGVIYQGRQIFLDRLVAIKMLKSNLPGERARMRFHQEAKAASQLNHPGIVAINDFGVDEEDRPYMVMEHVEGCTFSDLLRERQKLTVQDALPIFLELCDALSIAHHKGIVHRDLKPSNIMLVVSADGKVHTKLLDFGIAKMLDIQEQTLQSMTKTGESLGTPLYMSPEQIIGDKVTYRSDLYSLGCMMYACLTGTPPFIGQNKLSTMEMHCSATPAPLKQASKGLDFPPGMESIVMCLLEKKPEDRFNNVDELRNALVDMGVRNRFMRRPMSDIDSGQLYLTGAIPEMSQAITQMVPRDPALQGSAVLDRTNDARTSLNEEGFGRKFSSGTSLGEKRSAAYLYIGIAATILVVGVALTTVIYFGHGTQSAKPAVNVTTVKSAVGQPIPPPNQPVAVAEKSADQLIHERFLAGALDSELRLTNKTGLTEKGMKELSQFKLLRVLDLAGTDLSGSWLQNLEHNNLTSLNLDRNPKILDFNLTSLSKIKSLMNLSMSKTGISDSGLSYIVKCPSLVRLCISKNQRIGDQGLRKLARDKNQLKTLDVSECDLTDASAEEYLKFSQLRTLDLKNNPRITDRTLIILKSRKDDLKMLVLAFDRIGVAGIQALGEIRGLVAVDLCFVNLSPAAIKALSKCTKLDFIYLEGCKLSPDEFRFLANALPKTVLETRGGILPDF